MTKGPTLRQFQSRFPTEDSCLDHLFVVRYGDDFECPKCHRTGRYSRVTGRRAFQCSWCANQVYPTAGTPFDRTRTSLRDWFYVMFLFCTTRNGVAAKRVQRELGVTYKTAWRMCDQIRKYMTALDGFEPIGGEGKEVEIDETIIGGARPRSGHGRHLEGKTVVLGMVERGGEIVTHIVPNVKRSTLLPKITEAVAKGSTINTDALHSYKALKDSGYAHKFVNHRLGEYVRSGCHVQTIEGFWAQLKRAINGTHIHVRAKHLPKYLGEAEYRWNMRHVPHLMLDRLLQSFPR